MVLDLLGAGIPFESILAEILAPLQADVGARWSQGDYRIADEHAATGVVETLVALLAGSFDQPQDAPRLVVVCAEGDIHSLPPRMASAYLLHRGWHVTFLGASVPAADLEDFLFESPPDALVLSCTMAPWLHGARRSTAAAHAAGVPVMVGGRAFGDNEEIARAIGADGWAPSLESLDARLREWEPDPIAAEERVATPVADVAWLNDLHPELLAAGLREVRELLAELGWPQEAVPDIVNEFGLLIHCLASALLVEDPTILTAHVSTHGAALAEHGAPDEIGKVFVRALSTVLGDRAPGGGGYLATVLDELSS
jgi:methanogenic corrinoid protein MtbC1